MAREPHERDFLGTGWAFPPEFDRLDRGAKRVSHEADIVESLRILMQTRPGERVMQPAYGCGLNALVFEVIDASLLARVRQVIDRAVLFFEPRIRLERVDVDDADALEGLLRIGLVYTVRTTNTRHNVVFPFYHREGTLLDPEQLPGPGGEGP